MIARKRKTPTPCRSHDHLAYAALSKLWEIVKRGELEKVQIITMNFGSFKEYDMKTAF